jgi:hypothetical protein
MRLSGMKAGFRPHLLLPLAALCLLSACEWSASLVTGEPPAWSGTQTAAPAAGIGGQVAWQGQQAETQGRSFAVAETQEQWQELWRRAGAEAPGPLPQGWLGFGAFAGVRQSGGHTVEIVSVERVQVTGLPDRLRVSYRIQGPPSDGMAAQVLTSPWAIRIDSIDPAPADFVQVE